MTSTTTRIITIILAVLALTAPTAVADTTLPAPDWRHPDNRLSEHVAPKQDLRNADNGAPRYVAPLQSPAPIVPAASKPIAATDGDGTSPLVFIVPAIVLIAMLGAGVVAYARTGRPARGSVA